MPQCQGTIGCWTTTRNVPLISTNMLIRAQFTQFYPHPKRPLNERLDTNTCPINNETLVRYWLKNHFASWFRVGLSILLFGSIAAETTYPFYYSMGSISVGMNIPVWIVLLYCKMGSLAVGITYQHELFHFIVGRVPAVESTDNRLDVVSMG